MQATVEELAMLIGAKEIELMIVRNQLAMAQKRIAELTPQEAQPSPNAP